MCPHAFQSVPKLPFVPRLIAHHPHCGDEVRTAEDLRNQRAPADPGMPLDQHLHIRDAVIQDRRFLQCRNIEPFTQGVRGHAAEPQEEHQSNVSTNVLAVLLMT